MTLRVSFGSLDSSSRPTQTQLYSQKYIIENIENKQYKYTYNYMVKPSVFGQPTPTRDNWVVFASPHSLGYSDWHFALLDGFLHIFSKNAIKKCLVSCLLNTGDFL